MSPPFEGIDRSTPGVSGPKTILEALNEGMLSAASRAAFRGDYEEALNSVFDVQGNDPDRYFYFKAELYLLQIGLRWWSAIEPNDQRRKLLDRSFILETRFNRFFKEIKSTLPCVSDYNKNYLLRAAEANSDGRLRELIAQGEVSSPFYASFLDALDNIIDVFTVWEREL